MPGRLILIRQDAGKGKLRLSRGFPRRTRRQRHPVKSIVRVDHDTCGIRIRKKMADARIRISLGQR
jgi:hypothetical protein